MQRCSYCGRDSADESIHCIECGKPFKAEPAAVRRGPSPRPSWLAAIGWATLAIEAPALLACAVAQGFSCSHCRATMLHVWPVAPGAFSAPLLFVAKALLPQGANILSLWFVFGVYVVLAIAGVAWLTRRVERWRWVLIAAAACSSVVVFIFLAMLRA